MKQQWLNRCVMVEPRSFELLSLQTGKQPIFRKIKHAVRNSDRGIIPIHGILTKKSEAFDDILGMTSYNQIEAQITQAIEDSDIETILLDIDSPGGEVNGVFDLADFIYNARGKRRIIAIANDDPYSAAYAIASSAEKIFLTRTSGVGSIGVIASHIYQSGFDEKQGIKYTTVFAGSRKNDLNPHEPITSESVESLQEEVDCLYEMFVQLIARNRNLSTEKIKSTEAGLYFGEKAIEIGLADEVITYSEFIDRRNNMSKAEFNYKGHTIDADELMEESKRIGYERCRKEVLEVIRLCNLSKMPEKIGASAGSRMYEGAFIATMKNGHIGIFRRRYTTSLPIDEIKINTHARETMKELAENEAERVFEKYFDHGLNFILRAYVLERSTSEDLYNAKGRNTRDTDM